MAHLVNRLSGVNPSDRDKGDSNLRKVAPPLNSFVWRETWL